MLQSNTWVLNHIRLLEMVSSWGSDMLVMTIAGGEHPGPCYIMGQSNRYSLLPAPTAEIDRSDDQVYHFVMELVKVVVQLKNDVNTLPSSEYVGVVKGLTEDWLSASVGLTLRSLINSVDDVLPSLHESIRTECAPDPRCLTLTECS
ncbi:hypothetical protein JZ751_016901 [Albula glossodonta]|uniref:Focal AT domain-containing protein n=1 Tax=Albula glossodonta TaxID=121402 RepID=A0A8T2N2D2_9TELE|nr:hypothetical protein JZ751_016901 [Albula glossodonta]